MVVMVKTLRNVAGVAATLLMVIGLVGIAAPVAAQSLLDDLEDRPSLFGDEGSVTFRWIQNASVDDTFEFPEMFTQLDPFVRSESEELRSIQEQEEFAYTMIEVLGVDRSQVEISSTFDDFMELDSPYVRADMDGHLLDGDNDWRTNIDTKALSRTALAAGFGVLRFEMCTAPIETAVSGLEAPVEEEDGCKLWSFQTLRSSISGATLTIDQNPDADHFWHVVGWTALGSGLLTMLALLTGFLLLNRRLTTLAGANLVLSSTAIFVAVVAMWIVSGFYGFGANSLNDLVLVHELDGSQEVAAVLLPSFLAALPGLAFALVLIMANPPKPVTSTVAPVGLASAIPSWLNPQSDASPEPMPSWVQLPTGPSSSTPGAPPSQSTPPPDQPPGPSWNPPA